MLLLRFGTLGRYSGPFFPDLPGFPETRMEDRIPVLEEWCSLLDSNHSSAIDIAARRAVSAISMRSDSSDMLIDAVMAWENLFGTSSESTFRITAAITKLLESDERARRGYRKQLADLYEVRSRVVHGTHVDGTKVSEAAEKATRVALEALGEVYRRGPEWVTLSSVERADRMILEEP